MKCVIHSDLSPEKYLAFESDYLDDLDKNPEGESLLCFWESPTYFVVLGASNHAEIETHFERCTQDHIPILKRCSGGGTVLQGPGCLNYGLVLPYSYHQDLAQIQSANCFVMKQIRDAIQPILSEKVEIKGFTDLAINQKKFSGNAQRRKKQTLLFHGTFLLNFDLSKIETYLAMPSKQPEYRANRNHLEFIRTLPVTKSDVIQALQRHFLS